MRCLTFAVLLVAPALVGSAPPALAQTSGTSGPKVLERKDVSLALANDLIAASLSTCRAAGRSAVVAVVDRGGNLVALQRDDTVGPHNTAAAQRKAFTALSTRTATGLLGERARSDTATQNLNTVGDLLLLGGGVPLMVDGQIIGGLGVAGAGGPAGDEGCANQAVRDVMAGGGANR